MISRTLVNQVIDLVKEIVIMAVCHTKYLVHKLFKTIVTRLKLNSKDEL
jgi:hypothetical protein